MPVWTKDEALEIAIKYLGEQYLGRLEITDKLSDYDSSYMYNAEEFKHCWVIHVPPPRPMFMVGAGRVLCISQKSEKIIFDGMVGE